MNTQRLIRMIMRIATNEGMKLLAKRNGKQPESVKKARKSIKMARRVGRM